MNVFKDFIKENINFEIKKNCTLILTGKTEYRN